MKSKVGLLSAGALAILVALGSFVGIAGAQTPPAQTPPSTDPHPVRFMGRVDSVGQSSLQMTTRRGPVTVNVSDRTWIVVEREGRCVEGVLSDIQTGRPAAVAGMTTGQQGQVNARMLMQGRCGQDGPKGDNGRHKGQAGAHAAMGTIKSISGSTLVLTTERGGEATINTTANTVVINNGFVAVSTLKVGDKVQVLGAPDKASKANKPAGERNNGRKSGAQPGNTQAPVARTINAWGIRVVSDKSQLVTGRVESVSGNTVTLKTPRNKDGLAVNLDGSTAYKSANIMDKQVTLTNAVQADVKAESVLMVEGVLSADGKTLQAKAVIIMPGKAKPATP